KFRPSDWIERISTTLGSFGRDHRLVYSASVRPGVINGERCLLVDPSLRDTNPAAYSYVMGFVSANRLRVHEEESTTTPSSANNTPNQEG
ncbi:MAG: hypothetical protein FD130_1891, partial [Halothiobacillaceae bacterium]